MNKETTVFINSTIDFSENGSYSFVDSYLNNFGIVVINDSNIILYFEDGSDSKKFYNNFNALCDYVNENNLTFVKKLNGDKHWHEFNPNPKERNISDCTLRSYCAAFGISWEKAFDIASAVAKQEGTFIQYVSDQVIN